jgi:hypothetical protein
MVNLQDVFNISSKLNTAVFYVPYLIPFGMLHIQRKAIKLLFGTRGLHSIMPRLLVNFSQELAGRFSLIFNVSFYRLSF